jgi:hypothetical protein
MGDWWDFKRRQRRRWERWQRQGEARLQAWRQRWCRPSMMVAVSEVRMDVQQETEQAMAKAIRDQMGAQTARVLKESIRAECLAELHEEAVQLTRAELEDEFQQRRETLLDDLAKQKQAAASELEDELERREEALRRQVRDAYEERLETLKDDLKAATAGRANMVNTSFTSVGNSADSPERRLGRRAQWLAVPAPRSSPLQ